ncbi:hypothetical protein CDL15_Pgr014601 [Punica granatum]|uniref:Uncharacterized protein n=1 Tax=Punica granatum TaxID=22663 RepID=A0A218Y000_PUNGR|nr:hypothetical protein CDL15_Pgr014601 [Punica granatum]
MQDQLRLPIFRQTSLRLCISSEGYACSVARESFEVSVRLPGDNLKHCYCFNDSRAVTSMSRGMARLALVVGVGECKETGKPPRNVYVQLWNGWLGTPNGKMDVENGLREVGNRRGMCFLKGLGEGG